MQKKVTFILSCLLILLVCIGTAGAASVDPQIRLRQTNCTKLGLLGFQDSAGNWNNIEQADLVFDGNWVTYDLGNENQVQIKAYIVEPDPDADPVVPGGQAFDWTSNFAVEAVIVQGNMLDITNLYDYSDSYGDTFLHAPKNPISGRWATIDHIGYCVDYMPAPEFPAWFLSLAAIAGLVGLLGTILRK